MISNSDFLQHVMRALDSLRNTTQLLRELSKSGIVALVLISVLGGYLIGQPFETPLSFLHLALTLFGVLFLASGSSALNQYQERHVDAEMPRTAKRPLPSGRMSPRGVLAFVGSAIALGLVLLSQVSLEVFALGIAAVISYNGLYTMWWKRRWAYAAVPGAIPGALPILMGHAAASGDVWHPGGIYLFFILFYWQMPHFWVLALKFEKDYRAGGFPTLPVARGTRVTVSQIVIWCLAYVALALIAPLFLKTGMIYGLIAIGVSLFVLWELRSFVRVPDQKSAWLRFFLWINFSLILYIAGAAIDLWSVYLPWNR
jgi:protoheme IX farnesyltransferase